MTQKTSKYIKNKCIYYFTYVFTVRLHFIIHEFLHLLSFIDSSLMYKRKQINVGK